MIDRREGITEELIIIGCLVFLFVWITSVKIHGSVNSLQIGDIGNYGSDVVDKLRMILGH